MSSHPVHAIVGGFHVPVTDSRLHILGLEVLVFIGTGKPLWARIAEHDPMWTIAEFEQAEPAKVPRSARDSCDHEASRSREAVGVELERD